MAVKSKRLRFEILKRDGFRCIYCGATPIQSPLHVDHVKPEADGGTDDPANLVTACRDCNGGKSSVPLDRRLPAKFTSDEDREQADQIREYLAVQREILDAKKDAEAMVIERWEELIGDWHESLPRNLTRPLRDLGLAAVLEAVEATARRDIGSSIDEVRYFCGVLRSRREQAGISKPAPDKKVYSEAELHAAQWQCSFDHFRSYWRHRFNGADFVGDFESLIRKATSGEKRIGYINFYNLIDQVAWGADYTPGGEAEKEFAEVLDAAILDQSLICLLPKHVIHMTMDDYNAVAGCGQVEVHA